MLDSDNGPTLSSGRRSLSWLLAGGVVGLVGVAYLNHGGEKHVSFKVGTKLVEQTENCASGGQPSSCTAPEVAVMTSYGAWTVCGPNAGLPTQTGVFVGGIEACEAECASSSTCRGVQWVQGADSTQDICFEISDNICVHHTMTPPVAQGSVPPVQNAECIVKGCDQGTVGECVAGQTQCCPASLKREVNVAGDKLVQRFARRLVLTAGATNDDVRVVRKADGTVVLCPRPTTITGGQPDAWQGAWAIGTVTTVPGEAITQTLNPHLKVIDLDGRSTVVRYDPADPTKYRVIGYVTPHGKGEDPAVDPTIQCPTEAVQYQGRRMICATGQWLPIAKVPNTADDADCVWAELDNWRIPPDLVIGGAGFFQRQDAAGAWVSTGCPVEAPDPNALCPTEVFASADNKAIVCDNKLNVLGMVDPAVGLTVDGRATVEFDNGGAVVVQNPATAVNGDQVLGNVFRHRTTNDVDTGVWSCSGITCGTTSTCTANPVLPPGKWTGLLCVGVSPLPASLRGVFWKRSKGEFDDFPFIPDVIAFCKNTDGCGKSLGEINADGELSLDLRGEKVVDWLDTTVDTEDRRAVMWIREHGFCKLTFSAVGGKGSRHSPTWFKILASCDPTESESARRLGTNVVIPSYVTSQIDAFNLHQPFMAWVHGSRYNSLLPRGCTAWALWYNLEHNMAYAHDADEVTNLENTKSRLVSIVDDRGYTLENCGHSDFASLYETSSVIHHTYDNGR